jgi:hypothetical protein
MTEAGRDERKVEDIYGAEVVAALRKARKRIGHIQKAAGTRAAMTQAINFLTNRLTEAALAGCHHCDETEPPAPCFWCGLKGQAKPGTGARR